MLMSMSSVSVGRFGMLTLNVIRPALVFETTAVVMSGASAASPVESSKVAEFAAGFSGADVPTLAGRAAKRTSAAVKPRIFGSRILGAFEATRCLAPRQTQGASRQAVT